MSAVAAPEGAVSKPVLVSTAANASVISATIIVLAIAWIVAPTNLGESTADVAMVLLIARLVFLAFQPRYTIEKVTLAIRIGVAVIAWLVLMFGLLELLLQLLSRLGGAWQIGSLATSSLVLFGRSTPNKAYVRLCLAASFITFLGTEVKVWGLLLAAMAAAVAHLALHARLRGDRPLDSQDRNGVATAATLMVLVAVTIMLLWPAWSFEGNGPGDNAGGSGTGALSDEAFETDPSDRVGSGREQLPYDSFDPTGRETSPTETEGGPGPQESSTPTYPYVSFLWILLAVIVIVFATWLLWRRSQVLWIDRTVARFGRMGKAYETRLGLGQTLLGFSGSLGVRARPLAQRVAAQLDSYSFAPGATPTHVRREIENDLRALREITRQDRKQRLKERLERLTRFGWRRNR